MTKTSGQLINFPGHGTFSPDGRVAPMTDAQVKACNDAENAALLQQWTSQPAGMLAYYDFPSEDQQRPYRRSFHPNTMVNAMDISKRAAVYTFGLSRLGWIVSAHVFGHNFGGRMLSIVVQGTNGARYHGRASWDNGTCIWLRRMAR